VFACAVYFPELIIEIILATKRIKIYFTVKCGGYYGKQ